MTAPCRAALQAKTQCPKCHRPVSIKTLRYTHICGRTWDVAERTREEEGKAQAKHTHRRANMQTYSHKSIKLHEVPRERPTLRWRFVKCMCPTSHKRSRPGRVRDWQAL